jgi:hypothetical protein
MNPQSLFYTPNDAEQIKGALKEISPNWRDFMAIGMARTKENAHAKADFMSRRTMDAPCTPKELAAIHAMIERSDYWPS